MFSAVAALAFTVVVVVVVVVEVKELNVATGAVLLVGSGDASVPWWCGRVGVLGSTAHDSGCVGGVLGDVVAVSGNWMDVGTREEEPACAG